MSDDDAPEPKLPTAREVLEGVSTDESDPSSPSASERKYVKEFRRTSVEQEIAYAHLRGIQDHYKHKGRWSNFLMAAIAGMLVFQSYLLVRVGLGAWSFSEYEWLLPALLVQNLAQVVGLSVWAVKYLFSDISNQKPK